MSSGSRTRKRWTKCPLFRILCVARLKYPRDRNCEPYLRRVVQELSLPNPAERELLSMPRGCTTVFVDMRRQFDLMLDHVLNTRCIQVRGFPFSSIILGKSNVPESTFCTEKKYAADDEAVGAFRMTRSQATVLLGAVHGTRHCAFRSLRQKSGRLSKHVLKT